MRTANARLSIALLLALAAAGCGEPKIEFREVVRLDDRLDESDIATLERIARQLRGGRLPAMPPHFVPPPRWSADRPASVATLAREELARVRQSTRLSRLGDAVSHNPRLRHILNQERLTDEQYVALVLAVGVAGQKARLDASRDLNEYVRLGRRHLKDLAARTESFAALSPQAQVDAVEQATWVTRVDRAERLLRVPAENVAVAAASRSRLEKILPRSFLAAPMEGVNVPLLDVGVPFHEGGKTGFDSDLFWTRTDERAVIGGEAVADAAEPTPADAARVALSPED